GAFDFTGGARPESIRTPAEVIDWYSERFAQDIERLKQTSGEDLVKIIDFRGILHFPAVVYAQIGLSHSIHHRGQLSMYLRPMGAKVPSIYGESFDAREAREKGQASS
ncbi:MAG TPA: DinB family protein, partial [Vicinamibacteria bacterium]|nr:DinB family protein [Vicinamibacteria bacterium]